MNLSSRYVIPLQCAYGSALFFGMEMQLIYLELYGKFDLYDLYGLLFNDDMFLEKASWIIFLIIGSIVFLLCVFKKGTDGPNKYGPDPLQEKVKKQPANSQIAA